MAEKKFYWLKLHRDFFKRHDIRIIESQPNGKDYVLFYLKLLVESIDHEGMLRFSDTIPYNEQMLSTITDTNIDIVRQAVKLFSDLGMMTFLDDGTIHMAEVEKMIGSETEWAQKKRLYRERVRALPEGIEDRTRTKKDNVRQEKEKEKELEIEKDNRKKRFTPPSLNDVTEYCRSRNNHVDPEAFVDFYESKGWKVGNQSMKDWKAAVRTWEKREAPKEPEGKSNRTNYKGREYTDEELEKVFKKWD